MSPEPMVVLFICCPVKLDKRKKRICDSKDKVESCLETVTMREKLAPALSIHLQQHNFINGNYPNENKKQQPGDIFNAALSGEIIFLYCYPATVSLCAPVDVFFLNE